MTATPLADPWTPRPAVVHRKWRETHDTVTFAIRPRDGSLAFRPGQFNMLYVFGVGEVPISISGDPADSATLIHTVRAVGTVTNVMARLSRGATIGLRGPFGSHWPVEEALGDDVILVAGGLGLAPLRPALYAVLARRSLYGRVVLLYGARTPGDMLYQRELRQWQQRRDLDTELTVDAAAGDWAGHVGVITRLIPRATFDPLHATAFVCGPEIMMRFTVRELLRRGMQPERIFISMERNMKCAVGFCGHCQFGPTFICKDGPVFPFRRIGHLLELREV